VVLAQNSNQRTVQITGSNHIAADVHEFQPDVITSAATDATFVAEVQSGLATSAAVAEAKTEIDKIPRQGSTHKHRQISSDGATKSAVVTIEAST